MQRHIEMRGGFRRHEFCHDEGVSSQLKAAGEAFRSSLADALVRRHEDIQNRWLSHVESGVDTTGISPTELRNAMPDYLRRLAQSLRHYDTVGHGSTAAWREVAREHALTRVRLGFDIRQLVHEFIILREVLFDVAREEALIPSTARGDLLAELIEFGIAEAVRAYVEARDYAARRKEAEHVGFITHELRNPLTTALLIASKLKRNGGLSPQSVEAFSLLEKNLRRIDEMITQVLAVERFEGGSIAPVPTVVDLGQLLEEPLAAAGLAAKEKGLSLRATFDARMRLYVDARLTASAVHNLLENAIKFSNGGGVEVEVEDRGEEIVVHVRDHCDGLTPSELLTMFEPFERGPTSQPGAGLGLAIARRAIQAQGGSIDVASIPGRGRHFWFTLPKVCALGTPLPEGGPRGDGSDRRR